MNHWRLSNVACVREMWLLTERNLTLDTEIMVVGLLDSKQTFTSLQIYGIALAFANLTVALVLAHVALAFILESHDLA